MVASLEAPGEIPLSCNGDTSIQISIAQLVLIANSWEGLTQTGQL